MNRRTPRPSTIRRFALHPLSMALALSSVSTAAWASPFTGLQSTQNVTIHDRGQGVTDVLQSAQVGVIRTQGFGIGIDESLRALMPNAQSSLLIDVLGPVRTDILGSLTANGRILISNPYGVYFGAGAQINVGSLVATTLGVNSSDLLNGRIRLKDNGQTIGSVINAGQINASGTVALVGPQVSNEGHITAARVGLAATSEVLVDVEGDGLIFFQMSGEKAGQRLSQLGQITADGGVVDLRADARGTMADTVLNMDGLIQARSVGSRQGQVFIDGGAQGRTTVNGQIDASGQGTGEQGGQVTVLGQHVALGSQAHIDTRGQAGGGTILVGGNYQGGGTERRAETTWVAAGARLDASAIHAGNGGQVVVWSDDLTVFDGQITSRGGLEGGNGGELEVSGLQRLSIGAPAHFDALAPKGLVGNLLLDPQDIFIVASGGTNNTNTGGINSSTDVSVNAGAINGAAANLTLSASRDIVVNAPIAMTNSGVSLTLDADRNITVNQSISTNNGDLTLETLDNLTLHTITLGANLNSGARDLYLRGRTVLSGIGGAPSTITLTGRDIEVAGSIDGDGVQTRSLSIIGSRAVTLGGPAIKDIGATAPIGNLLIQTTNLTLNADTVTPVAGATVTLISATPGGQIAVKSDNSTTAGTWLLRTSTLDKLSGFTSINLGQGTGLTRLFDNFTAPTNLNFKDPVQLDADVTLTGGSRNITFDSTLVGQSNQLTINNAGVITLKGNATGLDDFKITQSAPGTTTTTLENGITVSASDELVIQGNVTLANPVAGTQTYTLRGNSVSLTHDVAAQDNSLAIQANTLSLAGALSATSAAAQATLSTLTDGRGISLATTAANTLELSQTLLTKFSAFGQLTIGRADSNSTITALALTLGNNLTLNSGTAAINLAGVTGAGFDLSLNSSGTTTLGGAITGVDALSTDAGGTTAINADITATTQTYNDGITLGGTAGEARILSGTSIDIKSGVTAGSHNLTLEADTVVAAGSSTADAGVGVTLRTKTADRTIGLAGGAGDTSISQATLNALGGASGFRSITVGASNGAITANALSLNTALILNAGTADITLAGDITTTGAQQYNSNVTIGGTGTRTLSASALSLNGTLNVDGRSIALLADTLSVSNNVTGAGAGQTATLATQTAGRTIGLAGGAGDLALSQTLLSRFNSFGNLTVGRANSNSVITAGALQLGTHTTLVGGTAAINLAAITGNNFDLTANTSGTTTLGGVITGVDDLITDATGTTAINADITATTQTYNDGITLGGTAGEARILSGTSIDIKSGIAAGSHNLTLEADTLAAAGSSTADAGVGVTLRTKTADRTIGLAGGAGDTSISQATLNALGGANGFRSITVGAGNGAIVANALGLSTALILNAGTADITLAGITGAGFDLSLNSTGTTLLGGTVTGVGTLSTNSGGATTISADITTTGAQQYNDNVTIGGTGTRTLSASALSLNGTVNVDGRSIALLADTLSVSNNVTGAGAGQSATLATRTADRTIGLAGGAGDLALSQTLLSRFNGFGSLTVGRAGSNSVITAGALQLGTHTTLVGGTAAINLAAITGNNFDLTANTSGTTTLGGAITGVDDLITDATGSTRVGANISSATQTYNDNVVLENTGTRILTANTLTVQQGLSAGNTGLSLVVDNLSVSGSVTASNGNTLSIDKRNAGGIALAQVNAGDLQISQSTLNALGGASGFDTLRIGSVGNNRAITTGALTLASDLILTANTANISLGTLTGAGHDLQAQTSGQITLGGNVSGVADLTLSGASGILISAANIRTTGTQTYQQAVQFTGADTTLRTLEASTLSFSGAVQANNHDLTLKADTFVFGGAASIQGSPGFGGTQTLTIATQTASRTIGLSGGAGDLQLPLDQVQDFDRLVVGDSSGTGQITVGLSGSGANIDFGDVTITSGTGNIVIDAALGSDMFPLSNLTLSTGGITRVNGVEIYADNLTFNGSVVLGQNLDSLSRTTTVRGNQLVFNGSVDGDVAGAAVLDTMDVNLTRFEGAVGSTQSLQEILTNDVELGNSITASSLIQFSGNISLFDDTSLTAPTINLGGGASTLNASDVSGDYSLALRSDTLNTLLGPINGGNELTLAPLDNARAIVVGNGLGLGQLVIDSATLARFSGFQQITVGSATLGTGDITIGDGLFTELVLPTSLRAQSLSGDITVSQAISGNHNLSLSTNGQIRIERDLGGFSNLTGLSSLSVEGNATLALSGTQTLRTSGSQTFTGALTLDSNASLIGASVRLQGSVDGARSLTVNTTGNTRLDGEVGGGTRLTQLSINSASIDLHDGSVNTSGNQAYAGTTTLHTDTTLSSLGGQVALNGAVQGVSNGGQALVIAAPQAIISQSVGTTGTRLKSLTTTGALNLAGGQVFTTGAQQYQGVTTLQSNATLTSTTGDVIFGNALNADISGTRGLVINTSGITRFTGAVGTSVALASLTTDAAGSTELGQGVRTTGAQTYNDDVTLTGAAGTRTLQGSALNFNGNLAVGAHDLQWRTDSLSVAGTLTANAGMTATIAPLTDGLAINLGGAGGLALSNTLLAKLSVFDLITVGRSDSNSTITASALSLPTALTLISSTGNITLAAVTGAGFDLTVNTGGLSTFGGAVSGVANLDTDAVGSSAVNADISTTGTQTWRDATSLGGSGTRTFSASSLSFGSSLAANALNLSLLTDSLSLSAPVSTSTTGQSVRVASLSDGLSIGLAGGAGTLSLSQTTLNHLAAFGQLAVGRSTSNSTITAGTLSLNNHTTLDSAGNIQLGAVTGGGSDLTVNSAGTSTLAGAITGVRNLSTSAAGNTVVQADITTTGQQTFADDVSLGGTGERRFTASALSFNGDLDVGTHDIRLLTDTLAIANTIVTGDGNRQATIASLTDGRSIGLAGGAGSLALSQALLNRFSNFSALTVGRSTSNSTITASALVLPTALSLIGGTGNITLAGITGGGFDLTVNSGGLSTFGGAVSGVRNLSTDAVGNTQIDADITTTGAQAYLDSVTLGGTGTRSFTGTGLTFTGGTLSAGTHGLRLITDTLTLTSALSTNSTQAAMVATYSDGRNIVLGGAGGVGDLTLDASTLSRFNGFTQLTVGRSDSNSAITGTAVVLPTDLTLISGSANQTLSGLTGAGFDLDLRSSGTSTLQGAIAGLSTLQTDAAGRTELNATVSTSGAQTYRDAVDVAGASTLSSSSGADLTFDSTVDGKTNGTGSLALNTAGVTRLNGAVGQSRRLASLSTDASGSTVLSADIATTGNIALQDAVTLAQSLTITHGGLSFGNTLNGAVDLNLVGSGTTSFLGTVGGTTALSGLTSTGGGQTTLGASNTGITTTGALSLSGAVLLSGIGQQLTATDLSVGGNVSGANGLTLTANTLAIGGTLTGTGALLIKPLYLSTTLGVGDGANATGTLRVTQAMLSSASGFASVTLGDAAGTGDINVGTAVLGTHTTLQTQSGNLTLHDAINSAGTGFYDLNLNSGGTTTVLGALGVGRALRNVITDDNLTAANLSDGVVNGERTSFDAVNDNGQATIVATERIVFNDPVTSIVDTRWQAGTQILAESTGNRLTQTVALNTAQVSLFNATNLQLGEVRLTGTLDSEIITQGIMALSGNLNLNAGSLLLQANATPTTLADFTSPEFAGKVLTVGLSAALGEASLGLTQSGGAITTAANAFLAVRTPGGASISLMQAGNDIAGTLSAVSGRVGESLTSLRPLTPVDGKVRAGFLRIQSKQLNVAGRPVDDSDQTLLKAGLEADVIELNLDGLNTALNNGLIRARLPYDNNQGSLTAMPALTINVSATGLNTLKAFGGVEAASRVAVSVGNSTGGFVTVKPKNGATLGPGYVSLGGDDNAKPFYDGSGKITEVPVFYNGDIPQSPQAVGALSAVTAVIEEARRARFEEAVRTENVSARLRSGVIAEVGSGRPATEGSDSIKMPDTCSPKANSLGC